MLDIHTAPTPNGIKIPIAAEELGIAHRIVLLELSRGDQKRPGFLAINPNGRIPAVVDRDVPGDPLAVFESGAILLHHPSASAADARRDPVRPPIPRRCVPASRFKRRARAWRGFGRRMVRWHPLVFQNVQNSCACSVVQFEALPPAAERMASPGCARPATPRK
ncbi:glutathione S-transferase N-terminal domain-containing protein [Roseomonas sp. CECT 9278]|uniref:glutathione S-transferase N-terminal domain-containing protein n=1 Tax=Roseomonas sp. CECT 9278 TaxID=2845823 RepID=UPI001E644B89|nr:glutathione S-transferase N-terminal domain-containing protein [Roseomonas sp. CECT 9278]CAH0130463.1 hypothetical protein ROS9278_00225 [Roseomonas sp. CECT 9278]